MIGNLNFGSAVQYHYGSFPPSDLDTRNLLDPLANASAALARYDQMLKGMHNSEILLAPLRRQEAVISSRMEGTVSTLDEVLQYEADQDGEGSQSLEPHDRSEAIEVFLYSRAMRYAQTNMEKGVPLSNWLIQSMHEELLSFGRGAPMSPGRYKTEQNYLADKVKQTVLFIPISPEKLVDGMERLFSFIHADAPQILIRTALTHLEFEALHPFKDGNGRIGRMLITLMLWKYRVISAPHFYVSAFFEENRDEYIDRMREVSKSGDWTEWVVFFLNGLSDQASENLKTAEQIRLLYEEMKNTFREVLSSQWSTMALDFIFSKPVFRNNVLVRDSGIPESTAYRFTRTLTDSGLLRIVRPASGRRSALYSFEPLLEIVRR